MIVLEGPDGGGKSTLAKRLVAEFGLPLHKRASDSINGPVTDLFDWAYKDVCTMPDQPLAIYDRHPLLSEYIYGPIVRSALPSGFTTTTAHALIRMMAPRVLVVMCRPLNARLIASVDASRDMPGVTERIEAIATAYDALKMFWPGQVITYDYDNPDSLGEVMSRARIHIAHERQKRGNL